MHKTLHATLFTAKKTKPHGIDALKTVRDEATLQELGQEMKSVLDAMQQDLLQPRPEAVAQLLKKVYH